MIIERSFDGLFQEGRPGSVRARRSGAMAPLSKVTEHQLFWYDDELWERGPDTSFCVNPDDQGADILGSPMVELCEDLTPPIKP